MGARCRGLHGGGFERGLRLGCGALSRCGVCVRGFWIGVRNIQLLVVNPVSVYFNHPRKVLSLISPASTLSLPFSSPHVSDIAVSAIHPCSVLRVSRDRRDTGGVGPCRETGDYRRRPAGPKQATLQDLCWPASWMRIERSRGSLGFPVRQWRGFVMGTQNCTSVSK